MRIKFLENKNRCTTSSVSVVKDNKNWLISHIITGAQSTSRNESVLVGGVARFHNNRSMAQVSTANRGSTYSNRNKIEKRSVVIYDHLGNLVTKN